MVNRGVRDAINEFNYYLKQTATLLIISVVFAMITFWIADKYTKEDDTLYKVLMKLSETFMLLSTIALSGFVYMYFIKIKKNSKKLDNNDYQNDIYCQNIGKTFVKKSYFVLDDD